MRYLNGRLFNLQKNCIFCFSMIFLFVPFNQIFGKAKEPEKALSASAKVHIDWNIDRGNTTNKGHLTLKLDGVMKLNESHTKEVKTKEISSFFPFLTYEPQTMTVQYEYADSLMDNKKGSCPPLVSEYIGNGTISLSGDPGSVSRASLYIRKLASMIPTDKFPGGGGAIFCDYYEFFAAAEEVTVRGRVRKSDCTFEKDEKDINLCKLGIRFQIPEDGKMANSREWSTKTQTGSPPFKITVSDLPSFMGQENFKPENMAGGDVNYSVKWAFGEVDLVFLYIMRKVNGNWEDVEDNDESKEVVVGEKVELKGVVVPKEKDPKNGEWIIDGNNNKNYIKKFKVAGDQSKSEVIPLKDEDLKQPEVGFYWYKGNKGNVKYTAVVDGKQYSKDVEFTIKRPDYTVNCDSSRAGNSFGVMRSGDPKLLAQWPEENRVYGEYGGKIAEKKVLVGLQYDGILFICEPQSNIPGETQWVQIIDNCQLEQERDSAGQLRPTPPIDQNCKKGLDMAYPCARNNSFYDAPGIPTNILAENVTYLRIRMTFDLYFMFKPKKELSEWVPLKLIKWKWDADVRKTGRGWEAANLSFVPKDKEDVKDIADVDSYRELFGKDPTVTDATEYPLWDQIVEK